MKRKCVNYKTCSSQPKCPRAIYCAACFKANAARKGNLSSGNSAGNPGNAIHVQTCSINNRAGERSGVMRSAKSVLVVKRRWLDKILAGQKTWEIRGGPTAKRGWIHFAQSGTAGKLMGRARVVGCRRLRPSSFEQNVSHHCVDRWDDVKYKNPYAWVLEDAERFERPFDYNHKRSAVPVTVRLPMRNRKAVGTYISGVPQPPAPGTKQGPASSRGASQSASSSANKLIDDVQQDGRSPTQAQATRLREANDGSDVPQPAASSYDPRTDAGIIAYWKNPDLATCGIEIDPAYQRRFEEQAARMARSRRKAIDDFYWFCRS